MDWADVKKLSKIYLYAGSLPLNRRKVIPFIGLGLSAGPYQIKHDVTKSMPLPDNSVTIYQSEDVFEHINYSKLPSVLDEIYRTLKPNGLFRLSMPDYRCKSLYDRSEKDTNGNVIFDSYGGGTRERPGHVWFPKYETLKSLMENSKFTKINYLHYYDEFGNPVTNKIDYSKGFIGRTPDHDNRMGTEYVPISLVVDAHK